MPNSSVGVDGNGGSVGGGSEGMALNGKISHTSLCSEHIRCVAW